MATPFTPDNIYGDDSGRWFHDGVDVTHHPVWWRCHLEHSWQATLAMRPSPHDTGCPVCANG